MHFLQKYKNIIKTEMPIAYFSLIIDNALIIRVKLFFEIELSSFLHPISYNL